MLAYRVATQMLTCCPEPWNTKHSPQAGVAEFFPKCTTPSRILWKKMRWRKDGSSLLNVVAGSGAETCVRHGTFAATSVFEFTKTSLSGSGGEAYNGAVFKCKMGNSWRET